MLTFPNLTSKKKTKKIELYITFNITNILRA